jgi:hypothetical protein
MLAALDVDDLLMPSACRGWLNDDLTFHMLLDAQRALVTFNSPCPGPADKDFVTYWRGWSASDQGAIAHARFVRLSAAAHGEPKTIADRWRETAGAAVRCGRVTETQFVTTQGHVLTTADFVATLVVEAAVHHLDLIANLEDKPAPDPLALSLTRKTLDGLLGHSPPSAWDDVTYILKATGRAPLSEQDRSSLGGAANRLPVFS